MMTFGLSDAAADCYGACDQMLSTPGSSIYRNIPAYTACQNACANPAAAAAAVVTTPWYLQWYVIVGVIGAVGLGIMSAKKSRSASNP